LEHFSLRVAGLSKPFHPRSFFKQNILVDLVSLSPETRILPVGAAPCLRLASGAMASGAIVQIERQQLDEDLSHSSLTGSETMKHP